MHIMFGCCFHPKWLRPTVDAVNLVLMKQKDRILTYIVLHSHGLSWFQEDQMTQKTFQLSDCVELQPRPSSLYLIFSPFSISNTSSFYWNDSISLSCYSFFAMSPSLFSFFLSLFTLFSHLPFFFFFCFNFPSATCLSSVFHLNFFDFTVKKKKKLLFLIMAYSSEGRLKKKTKQQNNLCTNDEHFYIFFSYFLITSRKYIFLSFKFLYRCVFLILTLIFKSSSAETACELRFLFCNFFF